MEMNGSMGEESMSKEKYKKLKKKYAQLVQEYSKILNEYNKSLDEINVQNQEKMVLQAKINDLLKQNGFKEETLQEEKT